MSNLRGWFRQRHLRFVMYQSISCSIFQNRGSVLFLILILIQIWLNRKSFINPPLDLEFLWQNRKFSLRCIGVWGKWIQNAVNSDDHWTNQWTNKSVLKESPFFELLVNRIIELIVIHNKYLFFDVVPIKQSLSVCKEVQRTKETIPLNKSIL